MCCAANAVGQECTQLYDYGIGKFLVFTLHEFPFKTKTHDNGTSALTSIYVIDYSGQISS